MGRRIDFIVVDFSPHIEVVRIHSDTKITILEKTYKEILEREIRRVTYEDIGGMSKEIERLRGIIEIPLKHPELFQRMGIEPCRGVLFHGKTGTGKTLLARALASETDAHFITIRGYEIMSRFLGQSEEILTH